ncbi:hypothetical protein CDV55_105976 [Aspergillus turcosus]|uniref:Uncharacterized protein n=1 Tax=Aspergillus turcosus TaxID=1245748 RepID=A0A229YRA5_9EURO|nr:hypothetical protein CDV55_105976 [Aspergillus turcosus]RLL99460.1 hypothetical protein CFD26_106094 [Aspergillus turcosus]
MSAVVDKGEEWHHQRESFCQSLWKNINSLTSFLRWPSVVRKEPPLFCLPECLLRDIFELLQPVDQACLSLSCKLLFYLFGSVLEREEFRFPRLLHIKVPRLCLNKPDIPRNQLLLRLEDARWRLCGACLRLHPRKEFPLFSLRTPPLQRRCMTYAGIVDLCPCLSLTFRDRARIVKLLKLQRAHDDALVTPDPSRLFQLGVNEQGEPYLSHSCWVLNDARFHAELQLMLFLGESDRLIMQSRYRIQTQFHRLRLRDGPIPACPHWEILMMLQIRRKSYKCFCGTRAEVSPPLQANLVVADVSRILGNSDWPADAVWHKQCRFVLEETYSKLVYW